MQGCFCMPFETCTASSFGGNPSVSHVSRPPFKIEPCRSAEVRPGCLPARGACIPVSAYRRLSHFRSPPPPLQITVLCPSSNTRFRAVCVQNSGARGAFLGSAAVSPTFGPRRYYSRADAPVPHTAASRNSCPCSRPPTRAVPTPVHCPSLIFALVHSAPITRNVDVLKTMTACVRSSVLVFW